MNQLFSLALTKLRTYIRSGLRMSFDEDPTLPQESSDYPYRPAGYPTAGRFFIATVLNF